MTDRGITNMISTTEKILSLRILMKIRNAKGVIQDDKLLRSRRGEKFVGITGEANLLYPDHVFVRDLLLTFLFCSFCLLSFSRL